MVGASARFLPSEFPGTEDNDVRANIVSGVYVPGWDRSACAPFFPIENEGGWKGYIDRAGNTVLDTVLSQAQEFLEGLAWICRGDDWYAIAEDGTYRIHLPFTDVNDAWPFRNGRARFTRGVSEWHDGGPRGEDFYTFEGTFYLVRLDGEILDGPFDEPPSAMPSEIPRGFDAAQPFSEGLAAVFVKNRWGYVDSIGNLAIYPRFTEAAPFHNGLARVRSGKALAYIDPAGNFVWKQKRSC